MTTPKTLARLAGVLYLLLTAAAFNELYVLPRIVRSGDAVATADNIRASATLFRLGVLGDLVAGSCWLVLAMTLYLLLRHIHQPAAAAMVTFAAVGAAIQCLNQLTQYTALTIATGGDYTRTFGTAGSDALTKLFVDMQHNGYRIDEIFFGLWLLPLGYLVVRSGYFPRILGVMLIIGGGCYPADLLTGFLAPDLARNATTLLLIPAGAAELCFMAWLLIRTVRILSPWETPAHHQPTRANDHKTPSPTSSTSLSSDGAGRATGTDR